MRTAADQAREIEPRCRGVAEPKFTIQFVEPAYSYVYAGPNDHESHMRGAKIHVRPGPGVTKEAIQLSLECHESGVTLGRIPRTPDDPYFLADTWLEINVDSEGDGFVARVLVDDLEQARHVLARARHAASSSTAGP